MTEQRLAFRNADLDVDYFDDGDGKVRAMARATTDEGLMARCLVAHAATFARSWAMGERVTLHRAAPVYLTGLDELVAHLAEFGLLDAEGRIPAESWERRFGPARDRLIAKIEGGRRGGQAKAEHALSRLPSSPVAMPKESYGTPLGDRYTVPVSDSATGENASALSPVDWRAQGLPSLDAGAIEALEARTREPWSRAGDRQLGEFDRLVGAHGLPAVLAAFDELAAGGKPMTARQLVWGAVKVLEPIPSGKDARAAETEAETRRVSDRRLEATQQRRLEAFQHTGAWDPQWGPPPTLAAAGA